MNEKRKKFYINYVPEFGVLLSRLNEMDIHKAWLANNLIKYCNRIFIKLRV